MGLRGKGSKPLAKKQPTRRRPTWKKTGLSRVARLIAFIQLLKMTTGRWAGKPFRVRPWQRDIITGIYHQANRRRPVRTALVTMGRKNGKTTLAAALAAAHLLGPEAEPRGEVYSAASDRNQAARIFRELEAMILADPDLSARCNIQRFAKKIEVLSGDGAGSIYEALSSDARKAHSLSPSFVVCDELAQWPSRELYDNLVTGTGARREPLTVVISTMSSDPHHVLSELVRYGQGVRDGSIEDPSFAAWIFSVPEDADPWDEQNWYLANPALADFRELAEMEKYAEQAQRVPSRESVFRNLYLNQPVNSDKRFIAAQDWDDCFYETDPETLRGHRCIGALDMGATRDLTALILLFPDDGGAVLPYFWAPIDELEQRERQDHVPYVQWHRQGLLEATRGRATDRVAVIRRIAEITNQYDLQVLAYDRWHLEDISRLCSDEGIELPVEAFGQGFRSMGPAVDALEIAILNRQLRHGHHPILDWNFSNAVLEVDAAGARKISKRKSTERVDGAVALAMAIGIACTTEIDTGSMYDNPDEPVWLSVEE